MIPPKETEDDSGASRRAAEPCDAPARIQLYDRYGRLVYASILRMVRNRPVAEDLVQETFLRAWTRVQGFNGSLGAVLPWLLALARNRATGYLSSQPGQGRGNALCEEAEGPRLYAGVEPRIPFAEQARRTRQALALLPESQRQAIELACVDGISCDAMAAKLGQPAAAVKAWLREALVCLSRDARSEAGQTSCGELREHYGLYALDLAEPPERDAIRAHLKSRCAECEGGVHRALVLVAALTALVPPAAPPARLRRRLSVSAGISERHYGWPVFWAAAALLCFSAAVYFSGRERQYAEESLQLRRQLGDQNAEIRRWREASAFLDAPGVTEVAFGRGQPAGPTGRVLVNPTLGIMLIASHLPLAPADKIYEMWIVSKVGMSSPAGLFQSRNGETAVHIRPGPVDVAAIAAVWVTLEDRAGGVQPAASGPVIVAPVR